MARSSRRATTTIPMIAPSGRPPGSSSSSDAAILTLAFLTCTVGMDEMEGVDVGLEVVGSSTGDCVITGSRDGDAVGPALGDFDGLAVGLKLGDFDGLTVGLKLGDVDGLADGLKLGDFVGLCVGSDVGAGLRTEFVNT